LTTHSMVCSLFNRYKILALYVTKDSYFTMPMLVVKVPRGGDPRTWEHFYFSDGEMCIVLILNTIC